MRGIRSIVLGVLVAAGLALAPSAFARGHVSIGIGLPGLSIGFSDCRHCGHGWGGNYGGYYGGGYGYSYAPAYYAPAYYGAGYYDDYYPSYGAVYYSRPIHRSYYGYGGGYRNHEYRNHEYRDHGYRDRDYGHRASYYDRGRDYHH
jgi:hypothetical protein